MNPRTISYINLTFCILLWAFIPVASKKILAELDNLQMLFYSTLFSAAALGTMVVLQRKSVTLIRLSVRDYARLIWLGFLGAFLYYLLIYGAFARTSAAEGFILAYTWPILTSLLAIPLLGAKLTPARLLAIAVSFSGVVVIVTRGQMVELQMEHLAGNLLALGGALVFALFSVQGKRANYDLTTAAFIYFSAALLCAATAVAVTGGLPWPSTTVWKWILFNGVLVNGVSYLFWFKALQNGDTFVVSNLLYLTPVLALPLVRIFLSEPVHPSAIMGMVLVLGGILFQSGPDIASILRKKQLASKTG